MFITCASERLVDGTLVDALVWVLPVGGGSQPDDRDIHVQLFGARLGQHLFDGVPAGSLQKQTPDVAAVVRLFGQLRQRLPHHLHT